MSELEQYILDNRTDGDTLLTSNKKYVWIQVFENSVCLDGDLTIEDLELIIDYMKRRRV